MRIFGWIVLFAWIFSAVVSFIALRKEGKDENVLSLLFIAVLSPVLLVAGALLFLMCYITETAKSALKRKKYHKTK